MPRKLSQDDRVCKHWIFVFQGVYPSKNPPSLTFCAMSLIAVWSFKGKRLICP